MRICDKVFPVPLVHKHCVRLVNRMNFVVHGLSQEAIATIIASRG